MLIIEKIACSYFKTNLELPIIPQEKVELQQSTISWLCENPLGDEKVEITII